MFYIGGKVQNHGIHRTHGMVFQETCDFQCIPYAPWLKAKDGREVLQLVQSEKRSVFITKNGYGDMVIMSMVYYEEDMGRNAVYTKLEEAGSDIAADRVKPQYARCLQVKGRDSMYTLEITENEESDLNGLYLRVAQVACPADNRYRLADAQYAGIRDTNPLGVFVYDYPHSHVIVLDMDNIGYHRSRRRPTGVQTPHS